MLPELEIEQKKGGELAEATVYTGFKAVTNFFRNIIDELEPGETYHVIGAGYGGHVPGLRPFFHNHHKRRANKKIKLRMLANYDAKDNMKKACYDWKQACELGNCNNWGLINKIRCLGK